VPRSGRRGLLFVGSPAWHRSRPFQRQRAPFARASLALGRDPSGFRNADSLALSPAGLSRNAYGHPSRPLLNNCGIVESRPLQELVRYGLLGIIRGAQPLTKTSVL
jgi:hypothetical protein